MKNLKNILIDIESFFRSRNYPILEKLKPGKNINNVHDSRIPVMPSIVELYGWKNGTEIEANEMLSSRWLFRMATFMSIERALEVHSSYLGNELIGWDNNMFPLFESGAGEFHLINIDENSPFFGMIFQHSIGSVDFDLQISQYDSLISLFTTIYECFESNVYYFDEQNCLKFTWKFEKEIGARNNPKSDYWNLYH